MSVNEKDNEKSKDEKQQKQAHFPTVSLPDSSIVLGGKIGPYTLLEVLGEGGFGIVYLAEQKEIIHRDIKPSNILISVQGKNAVPKIIDFGVAKAISMPLTVTGRLKLGHYGRFENRSVIIHFVYILWADCSSRFLCK